MNLRFLETFIVLAELRNFRLTAERLHTTQAAISSRIATLEQEFGVRLFHRGAREATLTFEGGKALAHAERVLRQVREMRDDLLDTNSYSGVIRIGAIEAIVHSWFPDFLALLQRRFPRLRVEIASDTSLHLAEQMDKGQLDLTLQVQPISSASTSVVSLGSFPMRWVASPSLGIGDDRLGMADLAAFPIMCFARGSEPYAVIERLFSQEASDGLHLNCIASVSAMIRVVSDGLGVAALPPAIIQRELADQRLRLLPVDHPFPSLPLAICTRSDTPSPLTAAVVGVAREAATAFALTHGPAVAQLPDEISPGPAEALAPTP